MNNKKNVEELHNILEEKEKFFEKIGNKEPVLFLDYDGTLSPIVNDPDAALLSEKNRNLLVKLAQMMPVAVISGRDHKDLRSKVEIANLYYAGSHGFEITGPDNLKMTHESEKEITPALDAAEQALKENLNSILGVKVERKKYAIAVHYRNADEKDVPFINESVDKVIKGQKNLKKGTGKKIVELKPALNWHKGYAVKWLLEQMNWNTVNHLPIFIGDDITDEDALETVRASGIGILVGVHGEKTSANYKLDDTDEVTAFLEELISRSSDI